MIIFVAIAINILLLLCLATPLAAGRSIFALQNKKSGRGDPDADWSHTRREGLSALHDAAEEDAEPPAFLACRAPVAASIY